MDTQVGFILKILLFSTGLSLLIKYGGQYLFLQPTTSTVLTMVLTPSLAFGLVLGWQYYK